MISLVRFGDIAFDGMQQAQVLKEQTPFAIGDIVGHMKVDSWSQSRWRKILEQYEVLVCTPMILLTILRRGFILVSTLVITYIQPFHSLALTIKGVIAMGLEQLPLEGYALSHNKL